MSTKNLPIDRKNCMHRRFNHLAIFALLVSVNTMAPAQTPDDCVNLKRILAQSVTDFDQMRGKEIRRTNDVNVMYSPTGSLKPMGGVCAIVESLSAKKNPTLLSCIQPYRHATESYPQDANRVARDVAFGEEHAAWLASCVQQQPERRAPVDLPGHVEHTWFWRASTGTILQFKAGVPKAGVVINGVDEAPYRSTMIIAP